MLHGPGTNMLHASRKWPGLPQGVVLYCECDDRFPDATCSQQTSYEI